MSRATSTHRIEVADDYLKLVRRFPLRPIRNRVEYDLAVEILGKLIGRADAGLTPGEGDYTDVLSRLVGEYDQQHFTILGNTKLSPLQALKCLMEEHAMKSADLGRLLGSGQGQASLILNGKRELSKANIRTLAEHFKVSAALFL
jgi:HTH-type transcriptional regulator / antitoxin HigA